ncbi:MAG: hypothetical protein ACT6Q7_02915 [Blastomonas fulva]|uniref:hypothetical protein n=1 Tax=Blastomonas fulva TaxID=1550728 RepID=UPI00403425EB
MDLMGEDGGRLASAFAAGWTAASTLFLGAGIWLRNFLTKSHTAQIEAQKELIEVVKTDSKARVDALEDELRDERRRCDAMETRLIARIQNLEGVLLAHGNPKVRGELQARVNDTGPPFNGE